MEDLISLFGSAFGFLNNQVLGIPIIAWLVVACILGMIGKFIVGKK